MIVGSIKENTALEKRVSLTPESAKNIIGLGLKVCVEKGYALHLGIEDKEYNEIGVEIKASSKEVLNSSDLITKVNCPSEEEIEILKDKELIKKLNDSIEIEKYGREKYFLKKENEDVYIINYGDSLK